MDALYGGGFRKIFLRFIEEGGKQARCINNKDDIRR